MTFRSKVLARTSSSLEKTAIMGYFGQFDHFQSGFVQGRLGNAFKTRTLYCDAFFFFLFIERVLYGSVLSSHFTRRNTFINKHCYLYTSLRSCFVGRLNNNKSRPYTYISQLYDPSLSFMNVKFTL